MKPLFSILFLLALLLTQYLNGSLVYGETIHSDNYPPLTGPYLGQTPPGLTPEVFAPGIISTPGWEYGVVFAPTMKEMYFVREIIRSGESHQQFEVFELLESEQGKPAKWIQRTLSKRIGTPTLSADNKTMFFGRSYKTRTHDGWSQKKWLGSDFDDIRIMRVTSSLNGTLAFDEASPNGILRYSTLSMGKRQAPKPFPKEINTGTWNAHPYIAPDESYVIWDGQRSGDERNADLFISFKNPDGEWGNAIKFGNEINTAKSEFAAQVTPDGKYLFFNRNIDEHNVDTYWVDADVIEQLKPEHIKRYHANRAPNAIAAYAVNAFREIPVMQTGFINARPESQDSTLQAERLTLPTDKATAIANFAKEIGEGMYGRYDSLLLAHNGKLVFESYQQRGRYNLAHPQASATKGYTSLILGRAMQLGYLTMHDLHEPLVNLLPKVDQTQLTQGAKKMTLHKVLTMQSGLNVTDEQWQQLAKTPHALQGQTLVQSLLEQSAPITDTSQIYKYGNYNPIIVMAVLDAVVPGSAQEFIKSEFLDKLNIRNFHWDDHISGLPQGGWRVKLTSRDMLKFGNIVAQDGQWLGKPFIHPKYLKTATSALIKPNEDWIPESYRYGYFWYSLPLTRNNQTLNLAMAWGGGGQRVIVVKNLNLVIAITGHDPDDNIMEHILDIVIPAFSD